MKIIFVQKQKFDVEQCEFKYLHVLLMNLFLKSKNAEYQT